MLAMPLVFIPALLRKLTGGQETVRVAGTTVGHVIDQLELLFPGIQSGLCQGNDLRPGLAAVVNTQVARLGLRAPVNEGDEVHFLPAIGGG